MPNKSTCSVFLKQQRVKCPIGWYEHERQNLVELLVSVEVDMLSLPPDHRLEDGVDYTVLVDIVNSEGSRERKLLETYASDIMDKILVQYPNRIGKILVTIEKTHIPHPGFDANCCGIQLRWAAEH